SKLEPAQIYHEVLDHRWFESEKAGHEIPLIEATKSYVRNVLQNLPDEQVEVPGSDELSRLENPYDPSQGYADGEEQKPYDPWEDDALGPDAGADEQPDFLDIEALRRRNAERQKQER
ncbi:MAG: DUF4032 domain-containing protein, partial [Microlunatus sp.]|nr:DUF4032 domain-containing protein [Microlunatus sp.]